MAELALLNFVITSSKLDHYILLWCVKTHPTTSLRIVYDALNSPSTAKAV
ncbi:MAG: hypothetical protein ACYSRP_05840 [Planctomycetota bacterium]